MVFYLRVRILSVFIAYRISAIVPFVPARSHDAKFKIFRLHNLRTLEIQAVTSFSTDSILSYISTLQFTNQGLNLLVANQNAEYDISDEEKFIIQESIAEKVNGKFEYELFKEAGSEEDSDTD